MYNINKTIHFAILEQYQNWNNIIHYKITGKLLGFFLQSIFFYEMPRLMAYKIYKFFIQDDGSFMINISPMGIIGLPEKKIDLLTLYINQFYEWNHFDFIGWNNKLKHHDIIINYVTKL